MINPTPTPTLNPNPINIQMPKWVSMIKQAPKAIEDGLVRCFVYGSAGSGKTTFANTFPEVLFADFDRGLISLHNKPPLSISFALPRTRAEVENAYETLSDIVAQAAEKTGPFADGGPLAHVKTLAIDSYTSMAQTFLYEIMLSEGQQPTKTKANWDHYGMLSARLLTLTSRLKEVPLNVVATCGDMLEKEEATGSWIGLPSIVGGFRNDIPYAFDEFYYFTKRREETSKGPTTVYEGHTKKFRYFNAKTRIGLEDVMISPNYTTIKAKLPSKEKA